MAAEGQDKLPKAQQQQNQQVASLSRLFKYLYNQQVIHWPDNNRSLLLIVGTCKSFIVCSHQTYASFIEITKVYIFNIFTPALCDVYENK